MTLKYEEFQRMFKHRKAGARRKSIYNDCWLYKVNDHFEVRFKEKSRYSRVGNGWVLNESEIPLARVDRESTTLLFDGEIDMTVCNRLSSISGRGIRLNKSEYRNYKQHVRVHCYLDSNGYTDWSRSTPYFPGIQFDANRKVVNPQPDLKLVVDNPVVQQAKREFDTIRKLTKTMARIGSFDEIFAPLNRWKIDIDNVKPLAEVNTTDPTGDDALAVALHGAKATQVPSKHSYENGKYTKRPDDQLKQQWQTKSIEKGLAMLRKEFYKRTNGYIEKAAA